MLVPNLSCFLFLYLIFITFINNLNESLSILVKRYHYDGEWAETVLREEGRKTTKCVAPGACIQDFRSGPDAAALEWLSGPQQALDYLHGINGR